jgi:hypothetical protein
MLLSEMVEPSNCIAEGPGIADVFPGQSGEAGAKRRDGSVHGLDKHTFAVDLVTSLTVEQDPTQFNYFCRIFCDIDAVFVACRRNMDDDVSIELGDWSGRGRHAGLARNFGTDDQVSLR